MFIILLFEFGFDVKIGFERFVSEEGLLIFVCKPRCTLPVQIKGLHSAVLFGFDFQTSKATEIPSGNLNFDVHQGMSWDGIFMQTRV